jgi:hypothetical protein
MTKPIKPLNGTKTHPLSAAARIVLGDICVKPVPRSAVNPGVANRLEREALVEEVQLPSPFKAHKGGTCAHLRITEAGRKVLDA